MKLHWFTLVIHTYFDKALEIYDRFLSARLGELVEEKTGGRGYAQRMRSAGGAVLYYSPFELSKQKSDHCCLDLSGTACDFLVPTDYQDIVVELQIKQIAYNVTRVDFAFDNMPFSPSEFYYAAGSEGCRSLYKRETLSLILSPFKQKKNHIQGETQLGTSTCYIGAGESERFIRCYDERGYTRLEFVCKGLRAKLVVDMIFKFEPQYWYKVVLQHLLDYVDFQTGLFVGWDKFRQELGRMNMKVSEIREVTTKKIGTWLEKQVSLALYVLHMVQSNDGGYYAGELCKIGAEKWEAGKGRRYNHLMQLVSPELLSTSTTV